MAELKPTVAANLIADIDNESITNRRCEEFADLEYIDQMEVINLMLKSFNNVLEHQVNNKEIISIPTIGKLKIKPETEIATQVKQEIANKNGYATYDDIPKSKLEGISKEVRIIIGQRVKVLKKPQKFIKSLKFNIKSIDK